MEIPTLEALLETTASNIENKRYFYVIGSVTVPEIAFVAFVSGFDVSMYRHIVENYALQHTLRKQGNYITEVARGQFVVSPETFLFIPMIIASFDSLSYELLKNRHTLIYEKEIGERRYFLYRRDSGWKKKTNLRTNTLGAKSKKATPINRSGSLHLKACNSQF